MEPHFYRSRCVMKGKAVGFEITTGTRIDRAALWKHLTTMVPPSWVRHGFPHHAKLSPGAGVLAGTILRLRGEKLDTVTETKTLRTWTRTTNKGEQLSTITHFTAFERTMRGMFFSYAGAIPFADFRSWMVSVCNMHVGALVRAAREADKQKKGRKLTNSEAKQIETDHTVDCIAYMRRDKLEELLAAWDAIREFEFPVSTSVMKQHKGSPLFPHTDRIIHTLKLSSTAASDEKKGAMKALAGKVFEMYRYLLQSGKLAAESVPKVSGVEAGSPKTIDLEAVLDTYFSAEPLQAGLVVDWDSHDPLQSPMIQRMRETAAQHPLVFATPSR